MAIYLDVLSPLKQLSLGFQQELHDPVKAVCHIYDFTLTMVKLKLLVDESLENPYSIMTNLKKLFQEIEKKDDSYFYQGIKFVRYEAAKQSVSNHYEFTIASITDSIKNRFEELSSLPLFKNLVSLLDVSSWPKELSDFGSAKIESLKAHFSQLLSNNSCDIGEIQCEWMTLKTYVIPIQNNSPKVKYLGIWERVFSNENIIEECQNVLHIFEILPITSFSNAKLERMFSRMLRIKNNWCNRLSHDPLCATLMICEEGLDIEKFNPDVTISEWYDTKVPT